MVETLRGDACTIDEGVCKRIYMIKVIHGTIIRVVTHRQHAGWTPNGRSTIASQQQRLHMNNSQQQQHEGILGWLACALQGGSTTPML